MHPTNRSQKNVSFSSRRPHNVVTIPSRPSRPSSNQRKYGGSFKVKIFRKMPPKFTGKNTMFCRHNASFFLLEYGKKELINRDYYVHTNNEYLQKFTFSSDRKFPNRNFMFSNFVHGIFRFLNFHHTYNAATYLKYFKIVRRHMHEQYNALVKRTNKNLLASANNNQTRTYFRFSIG